MPFIRLRDKSDGFPMLRPGEGYEASDCVYHESVDIAYSKDTGDELENSNVCPTASREDKLLPGHPFLKASQKSIDR